jgi:HTH-type transcriptional regulator / antitoxin HipB
MAPARWTHTAAQIGEVVAAARRHRGLTQMQLARELGVTQAWISQIEKGKDNAQLGKVLRVLAYLGVRLKVGEGPWDEREPASASPQPVNLSRVLDHLASRPAGRARKGGR